MEKTIVYRPEWVCSRLIEVTFDSDSHIISNIRFVGGCAGNTQGVARLCLGKSIEEVSSILKGINCPGSRGHGTSCPDQLSKALEKEINQ